MTNREINAARKALIDTHKENTSAAATVAALVDRLGLETAREIIAVMVVSKSEWDERITKKARTWAAEQTEETRDGLAARYVYYCDDIHPVHMDQIARAMMEYQPAQVEAQEEAAAAIEEPEETAQEKAARENRETCRRIAEEVEAYASGQYYRCPECGELIQFDDLDELEHDTTDGGWCYVLPCGCETTDEPEQMTLYDYFEDCLDVEYRVGADREYRSVRVMVTCGGPNIYVDTQRRAVCLYWWTETAEYPLLSDAVDAVDAWASEYWEVI